MTPPRDAYPDRLADPVRAAGATLAPGKRFGEALRRTLLAALAAAACWTAAPVQAQPEHATGWPLIAQRGQDRSEERRSERRPERRDERRERRREADRQQRESLTPDEHRQLNRDLQRANREIYRKGRERR